VIRRQLPQEISDLRLVAANQLAERGCILRRDSTCDEQVVLGAKRVCGLVN
jgi:hypothetical protein